jgi:carboxyl-terminal processing protease
VIHGIDGVAVSRGVEYIVDLMGRAEGATATLRVTRAGTPLELHLPIVTWSPPLVDSRRVATGIGYARLRFVTTSSDPERDAATLLARAISALGGHSLRGLVLDLRSNPGGYGVTRVASVLTDRQVLARYRDAEGNVEIGTRTDAVPSCSCPIVVLVDDQTLSSAELVTLALQDHGVARVVGQPSAGGLSVPRYVPLADGHVLMTPDRIAIGPRTGRVPEGLCILPDVVVPNRGPEDFAAARDLQLSRALQLLETG